MGNTSLVLQIVGDENFMGSENETFYGSLESPVILANYMASPDMIMNSSATTSSRSQYCDGTAVCCVIKIKPKTKFTHEFEIG